jgi:antitoxin (DNA-binding transcriptional repressor) of toxin-antitoxin stability system
LHGFIFVRVIGGSVPAPGPGAFQIPVFKKASPRFPPRAFSFSLVGTPRCGVPAAIFVNDINPRSDNLGFDGDTFLVSIKGVTTITSKELHEQTADVLDRVKRGQRFRVLRGGTADALLVPASEQIDPSWDEIMAEVRAAREAIQKKGISPRPNPVLEERRRRQAAILKNHAPHLR